MQKWIDSDEGLLAIIKYGEEECKEYQHMIDVHYRNCKNENKEFKLEDVDPLDEFVDSHRMFTNFVKSTDYEKYRMKRFFEGDL